MKHAPPHSSLLLLFLALVLVSCQSRHEEFLRRTEFKPTKENPLHPWFNIPWFELGVQEASDDTALGGWFLRLSQYQVTLPPESLNIPSEKGETALGALLRSYSQGLLEPSDWKNVYLLIMNGAEILPGRAPFYTLSKLYLEQQPPEKSLNEIFPQGFFDQDPLSRSREYFVALMPEALDTMLWEQGDAELVNSLRSKGALLPATLDWQDYLAWKEKGFTPLFPQEWEQAVTQELSLRPKSPVGKLSLMTPPRPDMTSSLLMVWINLSPEVRMDEARLKVLLQTVARPEVSKEELDSLAAQLYDGQVPPVLTPADLESLAQAGSEQEIFKILQKFVLDHPMEAGTPDLFSGVRWIIDNYPVNFALRSQEFRHWDLRRILRIEDYESTVDLTLLQGILASYDRDYGTGKTPELVSLLLKKGADPNATGPGDYSPDFHPYHPLRILTAPIAALFRTQESRQTLIKILLEAGARDVFLPQREFVQNLLSGRLSRAQELLSTYPELKDPSWYALEPGLEELPEWPVVAAVKNQNSQALDYLMDQGFAPTYPEVVQYNTGESYTALEQNPLLRYAVTRRIPDMIRFLMDRNDDRRLFPNGPVVDSRTILMALSEGRTEILQILLGAGLSPNHYVTVVEDGMTTSTINAPLIYWAMQNNYSTAAYLLSRGADINLPAFFNEEDWIRTFTVYDNFHNSQDASVQALFKKYPGKTVVEVMTSLRSSPPWLKLMPYWINGPEARGTLEYVLGGKVTTRPLKPGEELRALGQNFIPYEGDNSESYGIYYVLDQDLKVARLKETGQPEDERIHWRYQDIPPFLFTPEK